MDDWGDFDANNRKVRCGHLRRLRDRHHLTQEEMARLLGCGKHHVQAMETENDEPSAEMLDRYQAVAALFKDRLEHQGYGSPPHVSQLATKLTHKAGEAARA